MKKIFKKRYIISPSVSVIIAILLTGIITSLVLWCQPNSFLGLIAGFRNQPLLFLLNTLPIALLLAIISFLFRNVFIGASVTNLVFGLLSIANRIKIEVRDEPVFPRDLALLRETTGIVEDYSITYPVSALAAVIGFSVILLLLGIFIRSTRPHSKIKGILRRTVSLILSVLLSLTLIFTVFASNQLYNSFSCSVIYHIPTVFNELGFPYCFCHHFTSYTVDKPEGFNRKTAESWDKAAIPSPDGKPVHIIMIMDEAFSDVTDNEHITGVSGQAPLTNYHAVKEDAHTISGHIVVPNFAAGTANTEFDVLTGIQTNGLSSGSTSAMRTVNSDINSLFRLFRQSGYRTSFFHPGTDWFYNRENVYRWLGAENTVFLDQMSDVKYKNTWVTDDYMAELIEAEFENTVNRGELLFHFTTTIQNHMSYTADKYGEDFLYPEITCNIPLSAEAESMLSVYTEGVRDADALLGELYNYFKNRSEPVIMVFFGDHLPYLGNNQLVYRELGMTSVNLWNSLICYETPYIIWSNDAAATILNWDTALAETNIPETVSAAFFGAAVAELTGYSNNSAWYSFLNDLRKTVPVVQKNYYLEADGTFTDTPPAEITEEIAKWRQWSYYNLKYSDFSDEE